MTKVNQASVRRKLGEKDGSIGLAIIKGIFTKCANSLVLYYMNCRKNT